MGTRRERWPRFPLGGLATGHPVAVTQVGIPLVETVEVTLKLKVRTSAHGDAQVPIQPLADTPTANGTYRRAEVN